MEITESMIKSPGWVFTGLFYGYPLCCIKEFAGGEHIGIGNFVLIGTGYVPCSKCRNKTAEELIKVISKNRSDPLPFPEESEWDERESYVENIINNGLPEHLKDLQPVLDKLIKNR